MDEEDALGVGAPDGEDAGVIRREGIASFDADLAAIEAVRQIARGKLDDGAACCGYVCFAGGDYLSVDQKRYRAGGGRGGVAGDDGFDVRSAGVFGSDSSAGASTLATVQFGCAPSGMTG